MFADPRRAAHRAQSPHRAHGGIAEIAYGFPGYDGIIPRSTATVAEILRQNGYGTAMFGKSHVTPTWETSPAGPFDRWPTGLGFERFYGFPGAESSHWEPALYDQTTPIEPHVGRDDYHLTEDLADQAIALDAATEDRRTGQAVLPLLRAGRHPRAAPRLAGMDREIPRPVRRRLGRAARTDPSLGNSTSASSRRERSSPPGPRNSRRGPTTPTGTSRSAPG